MKIDFEGHKGLLWTADDNVIFYGVRFRNISQAIKKLLRYIRPSEHYGPWCCGRFRGIKDFQTGKIFTEERWFDGEKLAEEYLKYVAVQAVLRK